MAAAVLKHHQELAAQGDGYGLFKMGERYLKGDGVEADRAKGLSLLKRAAAMGREDAQALLRGTAGAAD